VREDAKREWLFLSARNFTFSTPTIRVKLTQEKQAVVAKAPAKKVVTTTLTCLKGKIVRKVTAISPKCPAGFTKK
jgi:hypothetical protein